MLLVEPPPPAWWGVLLSTLLEILADAKGIFVSDRTVIDFQPFLRFWNLPVRRGGVADRRILSTLLEILVV